MVSRKAFNSMRNLPVKTVNAYEGTLTRYTNSVSPRGGINEGSAVYSAPIVKGDLVRLIAEDTVGRVTVEKAAAGNDKDYVHGIAVASPQGIDNVTASGETPADALQRKVDIAFFGLAIVELEANGSITVGNKVELSESESNVIGDAGATGTNGEAIALGLGADGVKIPVLFGYSGHLPAD